jgi:hypothetical protein
MFFLAGVAYINKNIVLVVSFFSLLRIIDVVPILLPDPDFGAFTQCLALPVKLPPPIFSTYGQQHVTLYTYSSILALIPFK